MKLKSYLVVIITIVVVVGIGYFTLSSKENFLSDKPESAPATTDSLAITKVLPSATKKYAPVILEGYGFTEDTHLIFKNSNKINFKIGDVRINKAGTLMAFYVPQDNCNLTKEYGRFSEKKIIVQCLPDPNNQVAPGNFTLIAENNQGRSNSITFEVVDSQEQFYLQESSTPNQGKVGEEIIIKGYGFEDKENIVSFIGPDLGYTTAAVIDELSLKFTVPSSLAAGPYTLYITNSNGSGFISDFVIK